MAEPLTRPLEQVLSPSGRAALFSKLVSVASVESARQLEAFTARLCDALAAQSDQGGQSADADMARNALQHLRRGTATFHRLVSTCLTDGLLQEIRAIGQPAKPQPECEAMDLSLVTFEAMEQKVLLDNLGQALEDCNADTLHALNLRIAHLLQRDEIATGQNPFRPGVFLKAVSDAWSRFDLAGAQPVVLRQLRPDVFLALEPVLQALNDTLVSHGVLPKLASAYRLKKTAKSRRHLPLYQKLNQWLSPGGGQDGSAISPALSGYLNDIQPHMPEPPKGKAAAIDASLLRQIGKNAPRGALTQADRNAIELLAKMFDFVFREAHIPADIKRLLARLQVPVLKAALADQEFFFVDSHPARRLVETVASASVTCDPAKGQDDPLYQMIEQVVERVQQEYDQQIELFDTAATDLESYMAREALADDDALSRAIADAARQENIQRSKELADNDVAMRIESGEVAGFVETFLESQWVRILGLAHSVQDSKPEVLQSALKTMDDLIWSVKPKTSPEERKLLLSRLPSMLSMLNAWLNVVKWDGPDRVNFFSQLAERHASIVRTQVELVPRYEFELALNAMERASERRLTKRATEQPAIPVDEYVHMVDALESGVWLDFYSDDDVPSKCKLAWISPGRTRFIFAGRPAGQPFTMTFEDLAQTFREGRAEVVKAEAVMDRALGAVLEEIGR
jgi:hypothetical protein